MIEEQIINHILKNKSCDILNKGGYNLDHFYTCRKELSFILHHMDTYNCIPDLSTFLGKFPNWTMFDITESEQYLLDQMDDQIQFNALSKVCNYINEHANGPTQDAIKYLASQIPNLTNLLSKKHFEDLNTTVKRRVESIKALGTNVEDFYIPTGLLELDKILKGWRRGEEFAILLARTGSGKTFILLKTLASAWKQGYNVGVYSPEMTADLVGYRVDSSINNFSLSDINSGKLDDGYDEWAKKFSSSAHKFYVCTRQDFKGLPTVSDLKNFVVSNNIKVLGIDGLSYIRDERGTNRDPTHVALKNISEDLMQLSIDLKIPVIAVVQCNKQASVDDDEMPSIENIRDSDSISYNATRIISIRQKQGILDICVRKNRYGPEQRYVRYDWDIDKQIFNFVEHDMKKAKEKPNREVSSKLDAVGDYF